MSEDFRASDGTLVWTRPSVEGGVNLGNYLTLSPKEAQALREFFLHERDKELGRWRDPEDPNMYVITDEDGRLNVVNESTSRWTLITRELIAGYPDVMPGRKTGARYFAAHPEPRPWHDAKPGEVWVLRVRDEPEERPYTVGDTGFNGEDIRGEYWGAIPVESNVFTAGRRIWPEVTP